MSTLTADQAFQIGEEHHSAGRLREAEAIYRQILAVQPNHADSLHLLGVIAHQVGQNDTAIELIRRAISINGTNSTYYNNLGLTLTEARRLNEAIATLQQGARINPDSAQTYYNLGRALAMQNRAAEAIEAYRNSVRLNNNFSPAHNNLGNLLKETGHYEQAIASYRRAIELEPRAGDLYSNLANLYQERGDPDKALSLFDRALSLQPNLDQAWTGLGNAHKDQARLPQALECYRKAMAVKPTDPRSNSNLLYAMFFDLNSSAESIRIEHERWDREVAAPLRANVAPHLNNRDPDRRLRIGYVSPDFFDQAESFFVLPLLAAHDRTQVEVHCYSSVRRADDTTMEIKRCTDIWHDVLHLSDEQLAAQIRNDQIDILIDLTMHMSHNRILTFARKPAPVQIAWLAYPGTTGLKNMDYRITDWHMDPQGSDQSWSAEQPLRLPDSWCVYDSLETRSSVGPLPAQTNGYVTFGSMNNSCKTNDAVLNLWARVLAAVPNSRFKLGCPEGSMRAHVRGIFSKHQIAPERIDLLGFMHRPDYLQMYNQIDIGLDPFPYNGITTTCDALWMGVPVMTIAGPLPAARAGLSLLTAVGLQQFAVQTQEEYIQLSQRIAADVPSLASLRASLRQRMQSSPLTDARKFASNMEAAFRMEWRKWCALSK